MMGIPAGSYYERLSALDAAMLFVEDANTHMHVGAVGIFDGDPLITGRGRVDIRRIRRHVAGSLGDTPRHRQRLAYIPIENHPVWVDDDHFNLKYHLRHASLPPPGNTQQLKSLVSRIMSRKLDGTKPLWELWVIDNLKNRRFAMVKKMHHCMVDGVSAMNVFPAFFSVQAEVPARRPSRWHPRPAPDPASLVADEVQRWAGVPRRLLRTAATALRDPVDAVKSLRDLAEGAVDVVREKLRPASSTPLNPDGISPHRRFDWLRLDLGDVEAVKNGLDAKLNDVALATVAGALRRYLRAHKAPVADLDFRVVVPVNTRHTSERCTLGNRVVPMLARLPLEHRNARERLRAVAETTRALKQSKQIRAVQLFEDLSNWGDAALMSEFVRRMTRWWAGNMVVTNIPGPPFPLYFLGAPLRECYPLVPILANQAVGIALLSYAGGLYWGFNSDRQAVPDLKDLVHCVVDEFARLKKAAVRA